MAYLSEVKGTAFGRRYELDRDTMVLGRHPDCALILDSGAVSRQHAQIMRREGAFLLKDLGSRNGTYVNGRLISEVTQLHDGDMLRICDLEFSFQDDSGRNEFGSQILQSEGSSLGIMMIDDGDSTSGSRAIMSTLGGAKSSIQGGTVVASAEAKLEALLEITQGLARSVSVDDVLPKVLDSLFRIFVQADRGFIILRSPNGELVPRWVKTRRADDQETVRISRTILREVIEKREAIISLDASHDDRFEMSQSITDFRIRSMIIAPVLNSDGEAIGAIQIDTLNPRTRFESRDLDLLNSVASQAGIAIENAELHEQRLQQRLVEEDLRLATQVQQAFLPSKPMEMESFEFFQYYRPAMFIGGDYFDYILLPNGNVAIVVADVVGHGVAAAMFMAKLSAETRFALASVNEVDQAIILLNDRISSLNVERFVTFLVLVLNPQTSEVTIVNCGHMAPIWWRGDGRIEQPSEVESGLPIGITSGLTYDKVTITLQPGDSLTCYTDGINEAPNAKDVPFTINRIQEIVKQSNGSVMQIGSTLVEQVDEHVGELPQEDDMCIVVFGRRQYEESKTHANALRTISNRKPAK